MLCSVTHVQDPGYKVCALLKHQISHMGCNVGYNDVMRAKSTVADSVSRDVIEEPCNKWQSDIILMGIAHRE